MLAGVIEDSNLRWIETLRAGFVVDEGAAGPTVPKAGPHIEELLGSFITSVMFHMVIVPKILGFSFGLRSHQIPSAPTAADLIDCRKPARDMVWFVVRGCRRRNQANSFGCSSECGKQRHRFETRNTTMDETGLRIPPDGGDRPRDPPLQSDPPAARQQHPRKRSRRSLRPRRAAPHRGKRQKCFPMPRTRPTSASHLDVSPAETRRGKASFCYSCSCASSRPPLIGETFISMFLMT